MTKRMLIVLGLLALVFGGVFGFKAYVGQVMAKAMSRPFPPVTVTAAKVKAEVWQPILSAVGSLAAVRGVNVSPEVAGRIVKIAFESGQQAKEGQLLVQLDDQADRAELARLQALVALDKINLDRQQDLVQKHFVSQSALDTAASTYKQDQAQLANQEILVAKKAIRAPFAGTVGIRQVNIGQYLQAGTPVVSLQTISPIYVNFSLPQQNLRDVYVGQAITLTVNTYPDQQFDGKITAIDSLVNESTRNFNLQATVQNQDGKLRPGMFAQTRVTLKQQEAVITLPQTAVTHDPYGDSVFIIVDGGKDERGQPKLAVTRTFVIAGETRGDQVAITKGLKAGDMVVTTGQLKLKEGAPIVVDNRIQPTNNPAPVPEQDR